MTTPKRASQKGAALFFALIFVLILSVLAVSVLFVSQARNLVRLELFTDDPGAVWRGSRVELRR